MVIAPMRLRLSALGATTKVVMPLPVPPAPPVIVIHGLLLPADHEHVEEVLTATEALAPCAGMTSAVGVTP